MPPIVPGLAVVLCLLAGCADTLAEVERLSGVQAASGDAVGGPLVGAIAAPGEGEPGMVGGLAGRGRVDAVVARPGEVLPVGRLATACGLSEAELGTRIAVQAGYAIHDTAPTSVAPRTHFLTGFRDGCARQFTAGLALFGDLATHETMRYATPRGAYDTTDAAYEEVKARVCGAASGQPCGDRMGRLEADTAFVSAYPAFGAAASADMLLHRGEVLAADF